MCVCACGCVGGCGIYLYTITTRATHENKQYCCSLTGQLSGRIKMVVLLLWLVVLEYVQ